MKNKDVYIDLAEIMMEYYDKNIVKSKKKVNALNHYKETGYTIINQLLLGQCEYDFSLSSVLHKLDVDKITLKDITNKITEDYLTELNKAVDAIRTIDKIIADAPTILDSEITVFRGMKTDIYDDLVCENKKYYYTFPTYISTSFSAKVSHNFKGRHGVFYTLILPPETKGIYLTWDLEHKTSFGKKMIDDEFEFLLQRGSKFVVESIEYLQEPSYKGYSTYQNIPCEKQHPRYVRHYTMRLVSQPTIKQLTKQYKSLFSNIKVSFQPWELENVKVKGFKEIPDS